ncbi:unnamed protein product [Leuciscus chuanchicus]
MPGQDVLCSRSTNLTSCPRLLTTSWVSLVTSDPTNDPYQRLPRIPIAPTANCPPKHILEGFGSSAEFISSKPRETRFVGDLCQRRRNKDDNKEWDQVFIMEKRRNNRCVHHVRDNPSSAKTGAFHPYLCAEQKGSFVSLSAPVEYADMTVCSSFNF